MNELLRTVLVMSLSGSVLAVLLLCLKPLLRNRLPKATQYALWLVVLAALLVPVSSLVRTPAPLERAPVYVAPSEMVGRYVISAEEELDRLTALNLNPAETGTPAYTQAVEQTQSPISTAVSVFLVLYPAGVLLVLLYYGISYILFSRMHRRRNLPAREVELAMLASLCKTRRIPRLCRNALAATPMLMGLFRPRILLPERAYTEEELQAVLLHELTHLRRGDVLVKWLAVLACAVHWFNPMAWLLRRELDRACELACDESVIRGLDTKGKQSYGDTLISVAAESKAPHVILATTMCEDKKNLKERLGAIMKSKKRTRSAVLVSALVLIAAVLTACTLGAGARNTPLLEFEVRYSGETAYSYAVQLVHGGWVYSDYIIDGEVQMSGGTKDLKEIGTAKGTKGDTYRVFERAGYSTDEFIVVQDNGLMNPAVIYAAETAAKYFYSFETFVVNSFKLNGYMDEEARSRLTPTEPLNSENGYAHNYEEIRYDVDSDGWMTRYQVSVFESGIHGLYLQYAFPAEEGNGLAFLAPDNAPLRYIEEIEAMLGVGETGWFDREQGLRYVRYTSMYGKGEVWFVYTYSEDSRVPHRLVWVIAEGGEIHPVTSAAPPAKAPTLDVTLNAGGQHRVLPVTQLTTSWSFEGGGYEADSPHPLQLRSYTGFELPLPCEFIFRFSGNFTPDSVWVRRWDAAYIGTESVDVLEGGEAIPCSLAGFTISTEGDYVYEVSAWWDGIGSSSYAFEFATPRDLKVTVTSGGESVTDRKSVV